MNSFSLKVSVLCLLIFCSFASSTLVLHPNPVSSMNLKEMYNAIAMFFSVDDEGTYAFVGGAKAGTIIISLKNP